MSRKPYRRVRGIIMTTDAVKKGNRTYQFTEEQIKEAIASFAGVPMGYQHRGKPIGVWDKAWYEDGKVWAEGVIFEPESEREKEIIKKIESGEVRGLSPSIILYRKPKPKPAVLHGNIRIVGETENGKPVAKFFFSQEEIIAKFGSLENFNRSAGFMEVYFHDGSDEAKKKIEAKYKDA
jgi:hypothetical protein